MRNDAFETAISFTLTQEGGWVNDPADTGGETFRGISRTRHPNWSGWPLVDALKSKDPPWSLQLELAVRAFYRAQFWDQIGGDQLPPKLSIAVFDYAVHSGVERAVQTLQRLVGASPDGKFGPGTLASLTEYMDREIAREMLDLRERWLMSWVSDNAHPERKKWRNGFENRLHALSALLA